ncbi:Poly(A)+ RNA export protein rae1 [Orbilia javanica]|uniref:Poly(A)+ RNA export protein rae1 n=1 Tax=Orbilia javanica TaxID=47235 RepID=A0AAN8NX43_9PEZI
MASIFGSAATTTTAAAAPASSTQGDLKSDLELVSPPDDSIQEISFSPNADMLAVASWNKKVQIYEIQQNGNSAGKAMYEHEGPVLSVCWSKDGSKIFSGGADKAGRMFDASTGQSTQVAAHEAPVRCVKVVDIPGAAGPILVTGSWDKTIKYWDLRSQNPVVTVNLQDRCYTLDTALNLMVVGTADRYIDIFNLSNPGTIYKTLQSPLKWQTRVVSCFPNSSGFAIGSIEGRCAIQYVEEKDNSLNFSFKCHRENPPNQRDVTNVYSVNAISFHPTHGTFSTAGSDGTFHFWDKDAKHRLKGYPAVGGTISSTAFNHNGRIFAYAVSYDWSKGYQGNTQGYPNKVMLHPVKDEEAKPRPPQGGKKR